MLAGAIGVRQQEIDASLGRNAAQECEALAVRRKTDAGINVPDDFSGGSAKHGHFVERTEEIVFLGGGGEVNVHAVGGKRKAVDHDDVSWKHLDVAPRGDLANHQALLLSKIGRA